MAASVEWTAEGPAAVDGALAVDGPGARAGEVVQVPRTGVDMCSEPPPLASLGTLHA